MFSEFLGCLFYVFTILRAFPGDTLVPNKPINSEVRQPTNTALFMVNATFLASLLYIWCIYSQAPVLFNAAFFVSLFIYSAFIRKASSYKPLHR